MQPNFPNPFNPTTTIRFQLAERSVISLRIFDILGREVAIVAHGVFPPGYHDTQWNASGFASGVYLCRLSVTPQQSSAKAIVTEVRSLILTK
jgi:hypothetical protein